MALAWRHGSLQVFRFGRGSSHLVGYIKHAKRVMDGEALARSVTSSSPCECASEALHIWLCSRRLIRASKGCT